MKTSLLVGIIALTSLQVAMADFQINVKNSRDSGLLSIQSVSVYPDNGCVVSVSKSLLKPGERTVVSVKHCQYYDKSITAKIFVAGIINGKHVASGYIQTGAWTGNPWFFNPNKDWWGGYICGKHGSKVLNLTAKVTLIHPGNGGYCFD